MPKDGDPTTPGKLVQSFSVALVVLRHRKWRRNLIFGVTALTLFLVFGGVVILGDRLMNRPVAFIFFWIICFVLVALVLMLAILDLMIIRREHRGRMRDLEKQLADAAVEARELAAEELRKEKEDGGNQPEGGK